MNNATNGTLVTGRQYVDRFLGLINRVSDSPPLEAVGQNFETLRQMIRSLARVLEAQQRTIHALAQGKSVATSPVCQDRVRAGDPNHDAVREILDIELLVSGDSVVQAMRSTRRGGN